MTVKDKMSWSHDSHFLCDLKIGLNRNNASNAGQTLAVRQFRTVETYMESSIIENGLESLATCLFLN